MILLYSGVEDNVLLWYLPSEAQKKSKGAVCYWCSEKKIKEKENLHTFVCVIFLCIIFLWQND